MIGDSFTSVGEIVTFRVVDAGGVRESRARTRMTSGAVVSKSQGWELATRIVPVIGSIAKGPALSRNS